MGKQFNILASLLVGRWGHISYSYDVVGAVSQEGRKQERERKGERERERGRSRQTQMSRVCSFSYVPRYFHTTLLSESGLTVMWQIFT